jgi:hypothetical protein
MEKLNKSVVDAIDSLIEEIFEEAPMSKSMIKDEKPERETADEAMAQVPKAEKDEKRAAGRPTQISEVPQVDTDGDRAGKYDEKIVEKETDADAKKKEDDQIQVPALMKKSLSDAEFAEYMELKKAKELAVKAEILEKARKEQTDLIKSAVVEATSSIRKENEDLRKSLKAQEELLKSIANKPQRPKAITSMQVVEKFEKSEKPSLSKSELLDVAEELVKSRRMAQDFTMEHVIELEQTGYIFDQTARELLDRAVAKR